MTTTPAPTETSFWTAEDQDPIPWFAQRARILASNRRRSEWAGAYRELERLYRQGHAAPIDGPMIGVTLALRDTDLLRPLAHLLDRDRSRLARLELMATAWNATLSHSGLWMGKAFEPAGRAVFALRSGRNSDVLDAYDPATSRIGRNYFRSRPADPLHRAAIAVIARACSLQPRPRTRHDPGYPGRLLAANLEAEQAIPYDLTGNFFLAQLGTSVLPEMKGKPVYQLNYRWSGLNNVFPASLLVDEMVRVDDGIHLGRLVMASRHFALGRINMRIGPGRNVDLGEPYRQAASIDYGYQANGFFLLVDPTLADAVYADDAFPHLAPV